MTIRVRFENQLKELSEDVLRMGSLVEEEMSLALEALSSLDTELAHQVYVMDNEVNRLRFEIEEKCFALIVTQQPAARDLRAIVSVMNVIVDLERMGDQAKGIAKVIPHMIQYPERPHPPELQIMGRMVMEMLSQAMTAYANNNVELAKVAAARDDDVDHLYAQVFSQIMETMAKTKSTDKVEATYETLRVARELERYGDLATNIAERVVYQVTGRLEEVNVDLDDAAE